MSCPVYQGPTAYPGEVLYHRPGADRMRELEAHGMTVEERDGLWLVVETDEARADRRRRGGLSIYTEAP